MRQTLAFNSERCFDLYPLPADSEEAIQREAWIMNDSFSAQIVLAIDQVFWTSNLGSAIRSKEEDQNKNSLNLFLDFTINQIDVMVKCVRGEIR